MKRSGTGSTIAIVVALLIIIASAMAYLPQGISDTDPSTYIIIPLLMLPIFFILKLREPILPQVSAKDIICGLIVFAAATIFTLYIKVALSFEFSAFDVGLLMLPFFIASFVIMAFGIKRISNFKGIIIYSIFASPLVLLPLLVQNQFFTEVNSILVFEIEKLIIPALQFSPPITITLNNASIGIGQSCVGLGAVFGLFFLLLPIAYFYDGKTSSKATWLTSGVLLLLVLNIIRMSAITAAWFTYGPSQTILSIHEFAGVLLFYISIIVMILAASRYGLRLPGFNPAKSERSSIYAYAPAVLIACAVIYYLIFSYGNSYISPMNLSLSQNFNFSQNYTVRFFNSAIHMKNYTSEIIIYDNNTLAGLLIYNKSTTSMNTMLVTLSRPEDSAISRLVKKSKIEQSYLFMNASGSVTSYALAYSNNTYLSLFKRSAIYQAGQYNYTIVEEYAIIPEGLFSAITPKACAAVDWHSLMLNIGNGATYNSSELSEINNKYCIFNSLVSR